MACTIHRSGEQSLDRLEFGSMIIDVIGETVICIEIETDLFEISTGAYQIWIFHGAAAVEFIERELYEFIVIRTVLKRIV